MGAFIYYVRTFLDYKLDQTSHYISINTLLNVNKKGHFYKPQSYSIADVIYDGPNRNIVHKTIQVAPKIADLLIADQDPKCTRAEKISKYSNLVSSN